MTSHLPDRSASSALLVGSATFTSAGINDLPAVANNVKSLSEALTDPASGIIDSSRCQTMINPRTQADFGAALDQAVHAATDTVIVYYAGHGFLTHHGVLHLALADTNPQQVGYTAVPMEWLRAALAESPAKNRILVLDCCFSGHAALAMSSTSSMVTAAIDISGTYTMTSAPATSTSIALPGAKYTAFTGELLRVLRDGIPGAGRLLSLQDIYVALTKSLISRSMPKPQHLGTGLAGHVALGPNPADTKSQTACVQASTSFPHREIHARQPIGQQD